MITRNSGKNAHFDLEKWSKNNFTYLEKLIRIVEEQMIGLKSIHENNFIHNDASLKNFVVSERWWLYNWIDFGVATPTGKNKID